MKCNIKMSKCRSYDDLGGLHKYSNCIRLSAVSKFTFHEKTPVGLWFRFFRGTSDTSKVGKPNFCGDRSINTRVIPEKNRGIAFPLAPTLLRPCTGEC